MLTIMSFKTTMVSLVPGQPNVRVLDTASRIATTFGTGVIGLAACRPIQSVCRDYQVPAGLFDADRRQIDLHMHEAEREFRAAMAGLAGRLEWRARSSVEPLAPLLAREARAADLVIIAGEPSEAADATRRPDLCDLVMDAGRPVLLVPESGALPAFDGVLVGWKDTREARRAITDALPFLMSAATVTVAEIAADDEAVEAGKGLADIVAWLASHGVTATAAVVPQQRDNAFELTALARRLGVGLIVAGAHGYGRHGRWVLGGITSELLAGRRCVLMSA
jgi:nucleotide-binding universal stress UspA family protein